MKRKLAKITIFLLKVFSGIMDTIAPNINNSIETLPKCPITKKNSFKIDYTRLITSFVVFIILVLNFFGYTDIAKQLKYFFENIAIRLRG